MRTFFCFGGQGEGVPSTPETTEAQKQTHQKARFTSLFFLWIDSLGFRDLIPAS